MEQCRSALSPQSFVLADSAGKGFAAMTTYILIGGLIGLILGAAGVFFYFQFMAKSVLTAARAEAEQIRSRAEADARNKAKEIELSAKQEQLKRKEQFERENQVALRKLEEHENRL